MKLAASLVLAAAGVAAGWAVVHVLGAGPAAVEAASSPRTVATVRLDGPSLPIVTLQDALQTRVGAPLREEDLAADRVRISDILLERGNLSASVAPAEVRWGARGAHVTFDVKPGGVYRVGRVTVEGAAAFPGVATAPTVHEGEYLSLERARRGTDLVDQWLAEHGAPDATVRYRLDVRHPDLQADVVYVVTRSRVMRH